VANGNAKEDKVTRVELQTTLPQVRNTKFGLKLIHLGKQVERSGKERERRREGEIAQGLEGVRLYSSLGKFGAEGGRGTIERGWPLKPAWLTITEHSR
jgi:hypothetical protein